MPACVAPGRAQEKSASIRSIFRPRTNAAAAQLRAIDLPGENVVSIYFNFSTIIFGTDEDSALRLAAISSGGCFTRSANRVPNSRLTSASPSSSMEELAFRLSTRP